MAKRYGAVIVFREGITQEEAERELDRIRGSLDEGYHLSGRTPVKEYEDHNGSCGPVWYIP